MNRTFRCRRAIAAAVSAIALTAMASFAWADGLTTTDPGLPPNGVYLTADDVHSRYNIPGVIDILLERPEHRAIALEVQRQTIGADEIETFPSSMQGAGRVTIVPSGINDVPVTFTAFGPTQTLVRGKAGNTTGTFDTEMLSMNLTGNTLLGPFMIRESPTLPSTGRVNIADIGGGQYHIDSFFDVFTELSIDGGQSWIPSAGSTRMTLVPEPSSLALLGLAALGALVSLVRHRRRRK